MDRRRITQMRESATVFYLRKELPITAEDLVEMEQVGWPGHTLAESRALAAMLRDGLTVAANSVYGTLPPARYCLR